MTIANYISTSNNRLFQNSDNEYTIYFEYNGIIYVFRNTTRPENVRHENLRTNAHKIIIE